MRFSTIRQFVVTLGTNLWYGRQISARATSSPPLGQPQPRAFQIWAVLYARIAFALVQLDSSPFADDLWADALYQQAQWVTAYAKGDPTAAHVHMLQLAEHANHLSRLYAFPRDYHTVTADMHATWVAAASVLSADAKSRDRPHYADTTLDELLSRSENIKSSSLGTALTWAWAFYHIEPVSEDIELRLLTIRTQLPQRFRGRGSLTELFLAGIVEFSTR